MRNKIIFLTGGTGFIGSYMAHRLLREGHYIKFLARGSRSQSAIERIENTLNFIDPHYNFRDLYEVIEGDITKPNLGIDSIEIRKLKNQIDEVWHCAGSISFREEERDRTYKINVEGTRNVLEFAIEMRIPRLHYFSTAYIAGNRLGRVYEDELDHGQKLRNSYEETKVEAEKLVHQTQKLNHLESSIYRPTIVVGDSQSGRTPSFTGYYTFMRSFHVLCKKIYQRFKKYPEDYQRSGISFVNGLLKVPGRVPCCPHGTVNIVTIDYVIETIYKLANCRESAGKTFHIVNQTPPRFDWLLNTGIEILGLTGLQLINIRNSTDMSLLSSEVRMTEVLRKIDLDILNGISEYLPYISGEAVFDDSNVQKLVGPIVHPPVSKALVEKLLKYALDTEFGKQPFKEKEILLKPL